MAVAEVSGVGMDPTEPPDDATVVLGKSSAKRTKKSTPTTKKRRVRLNSDFFFIVFDLCVTKKNFFDVDDAFSLKQQQRSSLSALTILFRRSLSRKAALLPA